jgi:LPXTG-site transpeptidase (sortase) family protein
MAKRKIQPLAKFIPELLLVVGLSLTTLAVVHNVLRLRSLSIGKALVEQYLSESVDSRDIPNYPVHINIPWFVDVGVEPQIYKEGSWTISQENASYLTASSLPGNPGNIIIYGHNKRSILGNIRALKGYEKITLTMADGTSRIYQVTSITEVSPSNTKLLSQTTKETLTLYTCSGLMDSQRFVVRAEPLQSEDQDDAF